MLLTLIMMPLAKEVPLIVTLKIDEPSQLFFNEKRIMFFPAHANFVDAHITLFHKLPSINLDIEIGMTQFAQHKKLDLYISDIILFETSVLYAIESPQLLHLHAEMQSKFDPYLIRNDRKILKPHITIQNKVTAYKAQKTHALLLKNFNPFVVNAIGFTSWYYLKGYCEKKEDYLFG